MENLKSKLTTIMQLEDPIKMGYHSIFRNGFVLNFKDHRDLQFMISDVQEIDPIKLKMKVKSTSPNRPNFKLEHGVNEGDCRRETINESIEETFGVLDIAVDVEKYVSFIEKSIRILYDKEDPYRVKFEVECEFDMAKFAQDHELEPIGIELQ